MTLEVKLMFQIGNQTIYPSETDFANNLCVTRTILISTQDMQNHQHQPIAGL